MTLRRLRLLAAPAALLLALTTGCGDAPRQAPVGATGGGKEAPSFAMPIAQGGPNTLSGAATLDGEAIPQGRVIAFAQDGLILSVGKINDGKYDFPGLPNGTVELAVFLDPDGEKPFPTTGSSMPGPGSGPPKPPMGGGGPGMPPGGPGMPPGGPPRPPAGGGPGGPGGPVGGGIGSLPAGFLQQIQFKLPPDKSMDKFKAAHKKYAKPGPKNPLKVTLAGNTTYNLALTR